jgi:hypothetical protein
MTGPRHHTISFFVLNHFARKTPAGPRICQLEVQGGHNRQISPRDATAMAREQQRRMAQEFLLWEAREWAAMPEAFRMTAKDAGIDLSGSPLEAHHRRGSGRPRHALARLDRVSRNPNHEDLLRLAGRRYRLEQKPER